ncbi:MAG: hypothetical protein ACI4VO_00390 [Clostridia bacterium]
MMKKIKSFFHKINKHLILYSIALTVVLVITPFILKLFALKLRQWVYLTVVVISTILILGFCIKQFIKKSRKTKSIITFIGISVLALCIIFWRIVLWGLFVLIIVINPKSEHVVYIQGSRYVACVESNLSDKTVYYHKYINFIVMRSEEDFIEYYKDSYNPITEKSDIKAQN